jgi:hypothetical protein
VAADSANSLIVSMAGAAHAPGAGAPPGSTSDARSFRFEAVLAPGVSQADVMTKCGVRHLLDSTLAGYTATVMAYGQTGSGKTFTMSGHEEQAGAAGMEDELDETGLQRDDGLILRSLAHLYARMAAAGGEAPGGPRFRVRASYLEIYNEAVYDLLDAGDPAQLAVRWDATRGCFHVPDARRVACDSLDDALLMVATGARNRRVGSHELNKDSSRSHAICAVYVETARPGGVPVTTGKISFVDLAGSERLKSSKSEGGMAKETGSINRSLMALGKVISALSEHGGRAGAGHVPYRDSKLTKLLMDSLGGGSLALMVACCSPSIGAVEETLSTLTYATRAKNIVNTPLTSTQTGGGGASSAAAAEAASERAAAAAALREENAALRAALEEAREDNAVLQDELDAALAAAAAAQQQAAAAAARGSGGGSYAATYAAGIHVTATTTRTSDFGGPAPAVSAAPLPTLPHGLHASSLRERSASPPPSPSRAHTSRRVGTAAGGILPSGFEARFAEASREHLLALLATSEGALEGASAENASLRAARNELQAAAAARAAETEALSAKLRDLEACFLETERDDDAPFPSAVRRRMSTLLGTPPALAAEWDRSGAGAAGGGGGAGGRSGASRPSTARISEASVADESDAYYRGRTAPSVAGRAAVTSPLSGVTPQAAPRHSAVGALRRSVMVAHEEADAARAHTPPEEARRGDADADADADVGGVADALAALDTQDEPSEPAAPPPPHEHEPHQQEPHAHAPATEEHHAQHEAPAPAPELDAAEDADADADADAVGNADADAAPAAAAEAEAGDAVMLDDEVEAEARREHAEEAVQEAAPEAAPEAHAPPHSAPLEELADADAVAVAVADAHEHEHEHAHAHAHGDAPREHCASGGSLSGEAHAAAAPPLAAVPHVEAAAS